MGKVVVLALLQQLVIQKNTILTLKNGKKYQQVLSVVQEQNHVQVENGMSYAMETHLAAYKLSHNVVFLFLLKGKIKHSIRECQSYKI